MPKIGIIYKFAGITDPRLAFCPFPATPDFYEIVWADRGFFDPNDYPCSAPAIHPAMRGFDYEDDAQHYYASDGGSPSDPGLFTEFISFPVGYRQSAFQFFGLASNIGNSTGMVTGNCDRGCYCAMTGDGGGGNEQGYGLLLKNGFGVQLVQFTEGIAEPYTVLAYRPNVWAFDEYTYVRLDCVVDPFILKGVYLRAIVNGMVIEEFVYAGGTAFVPNYETYAGYGMVAYNSTVIFIPLPKL